MNIIYYLINKLIFYAKDLKFKYLINDMEDIIRPCNPMVTFSKFTFSKNI